MAHLQLSGISLAYGARTLFDDVTLNLASGVRLALAGANGCGKSTLMKIIAGQIEPDAGQIIRQKEMTVSYLPQSGIEHSGSNVREEVEKAFAGWIDLEQESHRLADAVAAETDPNRRETIAHRLDEIQQKLAFSPYYDRERIIEQVLRGLGFASTDLQRSTDEFSGGWQMRIALAKILCEDPDIMLLDEPTNYLDLETRNWLEDFLKNYRGGLLIVSHDRFFMDSTVTGVAELFLRRLKIYKGNYTTYQQLREQETESLIAAYTQQQEEIARIEDFIRRFRSKATKAAQVQSRVKMLEKMERIEIPEHLQKIHFSFPQPPHSGRKVLELNGIGKSYGNLEVLKNLDLVVEKGERIVVAGPNGAGKSTLLRILSNRDTDYTGEIKPGSGVRIGYFAQDYETLLRNEMTALEEIEDGAPTGMIPQLRNLMGAFLFCGDDVFKSVSVLSGGEKNRLSLLKLLLTPNNLLILDEPTNHLDIHSKDVLLDALKSFSGTLIFVSHDRYFIEKLATRVLELTPEGANLYPGDYTSFLWHKEQRAEAGPDKETKPQQESVETDSARNYKKEKEQKNLVRKLEKREEELLEGLSEMEAAHEELQQQMALPENYSDPARAADLQKKMDKNLAAQEEITTEWEMVTEELSSLV